jgi:hypothetical protein
MAAKKDLNQKIIDLENAKRKLENAEQALEEMTFTVNSILRRRGNIIDALFYSKPQRMGIIVAFPWAPLGVSLSVEAFVT